MITRCASRPEFLATFGRFVDETSIFVATHQPRPCGVLLPFAIALEDGETMLRGEAEVIESRTESDGAHRRPGMRLRILNLDMQSRAVHAELLGGKRAPTAPPPIPADAARSAAIERPATPPPSVETRVPGSSYIVPANPFTELPDEALKYFVECTLYEEASVQPEPPEPLPPAVPSLASSSSESLPVPAPVQVPPPPQVTDEVEPLEVPRRSYRAVLIASIGAVIGLGGGFVIWGLHATDEPAAPAPVAAAPPPPSAASPPPLPAAVPEAPKPVAAVAVAEKAEEPKARPAEETKPLPPASCTLVVTSDPADATVRIDGNLAGKTPLSGTPVACGEHVVAVEHVRYEHVERHVTAAEGAEARLALVLERPAATLELQSSPPGASFTVNGVSVGHAATARVQQFTFVKVKASLEGYGSWSQRVYVLGPRMAVNAPFEGGARRALKPQAKPQL